MNLVSSTALRYFAEVARTGSVRAASESLYVAASAISRQLALLEDALGAPVIERRQGRGRIRLTAAGELLMRYYKDISNESRRLHSEIEALQGLRRGHVSFGMPESLVRDLMPRFLADFSVQYPGITFSVHVAGSPRLGEMLLGDELDACFTFGDIAFQDLSVLYSRLLPLHVLVPDGHPLQHRKTLRLSDCAEYGLSSLDASLWAKQQNDEMLGKAKIRPRITLETNSYELMRNVAAEGMCLTFTTIPLEDPTAKPRAGSYVPLKDVHARPQLFALAVRKGRNLPLAVSTFIASLMAVLERFEARDERRAAAGGG
ncbi:MAG: LysR family transcriptional regulator [Burkholderiaceae bacterium]|nr:LysR family transcriptional regulator [Burkholderiaceae bacterium]